MHAALWLGRQGLGGGRPAALAALLTEAPQCVPFEQRVGVFRSLVAADKERCVLPKNYLINASCTSCNLFR